MLSFPNKFKNVPDTVKLENSGIKIIILKCGDFSPTVSHKHFTSVQ